MASIYSYLFVLAVGVCGGWLVHGWKSDSEIAAVNESHAQAIQKYEQNQAHAAEQLQQTITEYKKIERRNLAQYQKVIKSSTYRHQCLDDAGLLLINSSKSSGNTGAASR